MFFERKQYLENHEKPSNMQQRYPKAKNTPKKKRKTIFILDKKKQKTTNNKQTAKGTTNFQAPGLLHSLLPRGSISSAFSTPEAPSVARRQRRAIYLFHFVHGICWWFVDRYFWWLLMSIWWVFDGFLGLLMLCWWVCVGLGVFDGLLRQTMVFEILMLCWWFAFFFFLGGGEFWWFDDGCMGFG